MARTKRSDTQIKEARVRAVSSVSMGPEPQWTSSAMFLNETDLDVAISKSLSWYNYKSSASQRALWFRKYLEANDFPQPVIDKMNKVPESTFDLMPVGQFSRMFTLGAPLPDKYKTFISDKVAALCKQVDEEKRNPRTTEYEKPKVLDPIVQKLVGTIEEHLENFLNKREQILFDYKAVATKIGATRKQARQAVERYEKTRWEMFSAMEGEDSELVEAYSHCSKKNLKKMVFYFDWLGEQALELGSSPDRKPRKTKVKSPEQLTRKVCYLRTFKDGALSISSIEPAEIVGAEQLWVYNTKYRRLGRIVAANSNGLTVKGTTVLNANEEVTVNKTVKRPGEILPKILVAGKVALRHILDELNTREKVQKTRLNNDTLLLRTVR